MFMFHVYVYYLFALLANNYFYIKVHYNEET